MAQQIFVPVWIDNNGNYLPADTMKNVFIDATVFGIVTVYDHPPIPGYPVSPTNRHNTLLIEDRSGKWNLDMSVADWEAAVSAATSDVNVEKLFTYNLAALPSGTTYGAGVFNSPDIYSFDVTSITVNNVPASVTGSFYVSDAPSTLPPRQGHLTIALLGTDILTIQGHNV